MVTVAKGKPKPKTKFGQRLRELREAEGLSAAQLGERADMAPQTIAKYERGASEPMWAIVQRLASALGVSTDAFRDEVAEDESDTSSRDTPTPSPPDTPAQPATDEPLDRPPGGQPRDGDRAGGGPKRTGKK